MLTVLDCDGEPMKAGLKAGPAVVAPNVLEAEGAVGHEFDEPADLAAGLERLIEIGAGEAIITRVNGCVAIVGEEGNGAPLGRRAGEAPHGTRYEVEIDAARARVDRRLGRRVPGRLRRRALRRALAARSASPTGWRAGAESTQHFGAGVIDRPEVKRLIPQVEVREVDPAVGVS